MSAMNKQERKVTTDKLVKLVTVLVVKEVKAAKGELIDLKKITRQLGTELRVSVAKHRKAEKKAKKVAKKVTKSAKKTAKTIDGAKKSAPITE